MNVFQTNADGVFVGVVVADESPLEPGVFLIPAGCVEDEPPLIPSGSVARRVDDAWLVEVVPNAPDIPDYTLPLTPEQAIAQIRAAAKLDRTAFCLALKDFKVLPVAEAVAAARGEWPATFDGFTASLSADEAATAMIRWAGAQTIHYADPLLQGLALVAAGGNQTAATALLDQIFGLT